MTYTEEELVKNLHRFYEETGEVSQSEYNEWRDGNCPSITPYERIFGTWSNGIDELHFPHHFKRCPYEECGNLYDQLGGHWEDNPSHRIDVTERQHKIITGLVMGDATRNDSGENTTITVNMITKEFLHWLDDEFGILSSGVHGGHKKEEHHKDIFTWNTVRHPEFNKYSDWYGEDGKRFPNDLKLTPLILKVWYCCDGGKEDRKDSRPRFNISSVNESDRPEFIKSLFDEIEFSINHDGKGKFYLGVDESEEMWNWIGEPLPGFEYKWPTEEELEISVEYWTNEEIEILKEKYPNGGSDIEEIDRTRKAINHKASRLGITNKKRWTDDEIRILKDKYSSCGSDIPKIDRDRTAIVRKANRMGLTTQYEGNK